MDYDGLIYAARLDGDGGARALDWAGVRDASADDGVLWVHLQLGAGEAGRWLRAESGLDSIVCDALLAEETRPRGVAIGDGLLVILRGVNLNPGAEPEDMVSVRVWLEARRIVSVRIRSLLAVQDIRDALDAGHGPRGPSELLSALASGLVQRMGPVLSDLDDEVDGLEDEVLSGPVATSRARIAELRRQAIRLRRFLAPQRDVMNRLATERTSWIGDGDRARLREVGDGLTRYVEDLDAARDRAAVTHEELSVALADRLNKNLYLLSVVAALFLPLGFVTGLLGVNVGGIPGAEDPASFWILSAVLAALVALQVVVFRRFKLL